MSAAAVLLALDVGGIVLHGAGNEVQGAARAAAIRPTTTGEADGDWHDYGGTRSGRRYSVLADITPQNVAYLELAWTQHTGDLPVAAGAKDSEATPIHIGDMLYTCTPHSFVQAIDATTGKTKWSWYEDASIKGNN